jgi:IS66 Orf2 like protein
MLNLSPYQRIYLAVEPVDMRKQFNGLWAMASERLNESTFDGACFVLRIRRKTELRSYFGMAKVYGFLLSAFRRDALVGLNSWIKDRLGSDIYNNAFDWNRFKRWSKKSVV